MPLCRDILDWLRAVGDIGEAPKRVDLGEMGVGEGKSYKSGVEVSLWWLAEGEDDKLWFVRIGMGGGLGLGVSRR